MKKKKYSLGTGKVNSYIKTPAEALSESAIMNAKAQEAGNNDAFANIVDMVGKTLMSNSTTFAGAGMKSGTFGGQSMALGGQVEVEGEEVAETPDGELMEFFGPKHEDGGIDAVLPEDTNVFSDRILIDGMTMADRKKARNKKIAKVEGLLEKNPVDKILKNSHKKTLDNMRTEEESDLAVQAMMDMFFGSKDNAAFGDGLLSNLDDPEDPYADLTPEELVARSEQFLADNPIDTSTPEGSFLDNLFGEGGGMTTGDAVGLAGNLFSSIAPLMNTLKSRATDTPNINAFEGFGEDALEANDDAQAYVQGMRDNASSKIQLSTNAARARGRNSARGVNALRAVDLGTQMQANRAEMDAQDMFAKQMLALLSQRAQLENQQDRAVMTGEYQRDLADRQDKDNFYTNRGRDLSTMGTGIQQTGKDLNAIKKREIVSTLLDQLSKYGISFDGDYKLTTEDDG